MVFIWFLYVAEFAIRLISLHKTIVNIKIRRGKILKDVDMLRSKVDEYVDAHSKGKDKTKLRIIIK